MKLKSGSVELLAHDGAADYLGRRLCCHSSTTVDIQNRLDKAWKKFFLYKPELCGKHVSLKTRLKLFDSIITPTMLYGSGTWTMVAERERMLRTAQRRMLRWMLRSHWKNVESSSSSDDSSESSEPTDEETEENENNTEEESFVDWIQRCTHLVEEQLAFCKIIGLWRKGNANGGWRVIRPDALMEDGLKQFWGGYHKVALAVGVIQNVVGWIVRTTSSLRKADCQKVFGRMSRKTDKRGTT